MPGQPFEYQPDRPEVVIETPRDAMFACLYDIDPNFGTTYSEALLKPPQRVYDEFGGVRAYEFYASCEDQLDVSTGARWLGVRIGMAESWYTLESAASLKPLFKGDFYTTTLLDKLQTDIGVTIRWAYEVDSASVGVLRKSELIISDDRLTRFMEKFNLLSRKEVPREPQMNAQVDRGPAIYFSGRTERHKLAEFEADIDTQRLNDIMMFLGWAQYRIPTSS